MAAAQATAGFTLRCPAPERSIAGGDPKAMQMVVLPQYRRRLAPLLLVGDTSSPCLELLGRWGPLDEGAGHVEVERLLSVAGTCYQLGRALGRDRRCCARKEKGACVSALLGGGVEVKRLLSAAGARKSGEFQACQ